ncbi:MAG TPA: universal stress protein [Acidimicrobiales bacterium]|nr:universal stress protein [Acidimicrobiales bacterium]
MTTMILLGFDGSPDAVAAARWAAREAAHHGAVLHILHTYDYPYLERLDRQAQRLLAEEANAVCELGRQTAADEAPQLEIRTSVRVGQPAPELIAAAEDADLLVLGRHGHLPLHRLLLGSVANKCLHHVTCPVVIVVDPDDAAASR